MIASPTHYQCNHWRSSWSMSFLMITPRTFFTHFARIELPFVMLAGNWADMEFVIRSPADDVSSLAWSLNFSKIDSSLIWMHWSGCKGPICVRTGWRLIQKADGCRDKWRMSISSWPSLSNKSIHFWFCWGWLLILHVVNTRWYVISWNDL